MVTIEETDFKASWSCPAADVSDAGPLVSAARKLIG